MDFAAMLGLVSVFVLVLANGFFVATEFAIVAVRRSRLDQLVEEGRPGAHAARTVVAHLDAYIAATQFGITLASLALGWIGEPALAHLIEPPLAYVVGGFAPAAAHGIAIGVAFALITALHIVMGELAPKGLALQSPEITTLWVARPIQIFHAIFKWPVTALNAVGNGTLRLFGLKPASGHEMVHSAEARIARRAFVFGELTASSLMTPRTEIEAVPVTSTVEELLRKAETTRRNRLPVYEGSLDNVIGILYVRELFKHRHTPPDVFALRSLIRPPMLVPETKYATELLEDMRTQHCHMAVVGDEYGGTAGLVTLRDLLEALVGRIDDVPSHELSHSIAESPETDGAMLLNGLMRVEEFEEATGIRLDDESHERVDTLGGLFTAVLGRFPEIGEEITVNGRTLRVEPRDGLRVATVRLLPPPTPLRGDTPTRSDA